jgi:PAS domain S-box-containing protein
VSETFGGQVKRKEALKGMIKELHEGADPEEVKTRFAEVVRDVGPSEIALMEQELIEEGMPREEIQRLCDVHLAVFRESLDRGAAAPSAGHPVHILMEEHKLLLAFADDLRTLAGQLRDVEGSRDERMGRLEEIVHHFKESESHYVREENVFFPSLEKHGVTEPPAIMWMEHDKIRAIEKQLYGLVDSREEIAAGDFASRLLEVAESLSQMLSSHFQKENNVLFPTALRLIGAREWMQIRAQFDELGYCCFTPEPPREVAPEAEMLLPRAEGRGVIDFPTGSLSTEELEAVLSTLPVDVTFVDRDDTVRYFSQSTDRIFPRTRAVIGRKVQQCHPQKSVHVVNQILSDFKSGKKDVAEFWIDLKGRLIYIRYWPVRNDKGEYLGCLEVTQDVTEIKKIEGEKRLL